MLRNHIAENLSLMTKRLACERFTAEVLVQSFSTHIRKRTTTMQSKSACRTKACMLLQGCFCYEGCHSIQDCAEVDPCTIVPFTARTNITTGGRLRWLKINMLRTASPAS